jgi:hypothetical protein
VTTDQDVIIEQDRAVGGACDTAGTTPDIARFGNADSVGETVFFTAMKETNMTITCGDIGNFECDAVIIDDANPFSYSTNVLESARTCIIVAMAGPQYIKGSMDNCEACPVVDVYSGSSSSRVAHITGPSGFDGNSDAKSPLIVVISADGKREIDFEGFEFTVTSEAAPARKPIHVKWSSKWMTKRSDPVIREYHVGDYCAFAGMGLMGMLMAVMAIWMVCKEARNRRRERKLGMSLGSSLLFSKSVTGYDTRPGE